MKNVGLGVLGAVLGAVFYLSSLINFVFTSFVTQSFQIHPGFLLGINFLVAIFVCFLISLQNKIVAGFFGAVCLALTLITIGLIMTGYADLVWNALW